jgi:hypothetical protein
LRAPRNSGKRQQQHCNQIEYAPRCRHDLPLALAPHCIRKK